MKRCNSSKRYLFVGLTDRHHFDNPVYCYPTGGANGGVGGATAAVGGLNNARIPNHLGCPGTKSNLTNLERAKLGPNSLDDDCSEGIFKNRHGHTTAICFP